MHPALEPLVEGEIPGFKLVHDKGLDIYEIDYAVFPPMNLVIQYFKQELNKKEVYCPFVILCDICKNI